MNLERLFPQIVDEVKGCADPNRCWMDILRRTKQDETRLVGANISDDVSRLEQQIADVRAEAPFPRNLTFLYFGLFDAISRSKVKVGFYISGGTGERPEQELASARLSYFPENRFLETETLEIIKDVAKAKKSERDILEYAVMFGAASILAKFAVAGCNVSLPVFVGFDSGDFAQIG